MKLIIAFFLIVLAFLALPLHAEVVAQNGSKKLENYITSWIGNSYGGLNPETGKGQWVQQDIAAMCVSPDGTVYTNVPWEEGGGNCMMYKDGKMLGHAGHTHGWGFNGGKAVAVNDKYVYIALKGNNENGGLKDPDTWPPKGFDWFGVSRRLRSDFTKGAPFEGGKGGKGDTLPKSFLVVNEVPNEKGKNSTDAVAIGGLYANNAELFVSNPLTNKIEVYHAEKMWKLVEWDIPTDLQGKIGQITQAPDGNFWVLIERSDRVSLEERFAVFDSTGKSLSCPIRTSTVSEGSFYRDLIPSAFCFDPQGRLLVADAGRLQSILVIEKRDGKYDLSQRMTGWPLFSPRPGAFGEPIFRNNTTIGCDAIGNICIASDWATNGGGAILESYPVITNKMGLNSEDYRFLKRNWRLHGLCFIDCATLDPDDETIAYTKEERYKIDWSKEPGNEATFTGLTAFRPNASFKTETPSNDGKDYFRDPRLNIGDSAPVWVRNLGGAKFLFVGDMNSARLQVYRLNSDEKRLPVEAAVLFSPEHYRLRDHSEPVDWLPGQPAEGEWIWTNSLSNTTRIFMKPDEFLSRKENAPRIEGWCIEPGGSIWQATLDKGLRRFRFQGLNQLGYPIWNFENMDIFPHPAEFKQVKRIRYDAQSDTLYLGGCATVDGVEHKNQHWKPMGPVVCRYDNFLKGKDPGKTEGKLRWKVVLPYVSGSKGHESCEPMGFDIAGKYMFIPYTGASKESGFKTGHVEVFRLDDAKPVGWMEPDPKTVGEIGLQDIRECLSAHLRKNGEYVIFLEDDYKAKVVMFRAVLP